MRQFLISSLAMAVLLSTMAVRAQADDVVETTAIEQPEAAKPHPEHQWLERFVGDWTSEAECKTAPDKPVVTCSGTQQARMLGGFWMIAEAKAEMMGTAVNSVLTIGFDPNKQKFVASWTDSCFPHMWHYEGTLDEGGNLLTLLTEGPNLMLGGKVTRYRETIEFQDDDHYVFTSSMEGEDGEWNTFMTANFRRVK